MPALFVIVMSSCSLFQKEDDSKNLTLGNYERISNTDFVDHLKNFETFFLNSQNVDILQLKAKDRRYLEKLIDLILDKNRVFFTKIDDATIQLVRSEVPFHFSLPGRKIFLSTGLFKKYIQNESLLLCVLTFELIRSEKNYYRKALIVPIGFLNPEDILPLLRLSAIEKMEIHKWSFRLLKKIDIDSDNYLSWLQIQNRNSIDFSMQLGDINKISREEALFKAFIISNSRGEKKREYKSSTKDFYEFLRTVRNT